MFGHKEKKRNAELVAPIWLSDMQKARDVVNKTTDPDAFFTEYDSLKELAEKLTVAAKYVKLKGTKPVEVLRMAREQEEAATRDFILRCFARARLNAEKVKTEKGKRSQFEKFQSSLEPYFFRMSKENAELVQAFHDQEVAKLGG